MNIPHAEWSEASGGIVQDESGKLWRIIGFIDQPTVILDPIVEMGSPLAQADTRHRQYQVMGSEISKRFRRLVPAPEREGAGVGR